MLHDKRSKRIPLRAQNTLFLFLCWRSPDRQEKIILHNLIYEGLRTVILTQGTVLQRLLAADPTAVRYGYASVKTMSRKINPSSGTLSSFLFEACLSRSLTSRLPQSQPGKETPAPSRGAVAGDPSAPCRRQTRAANTDPHGSNPRTVTNDGSPQPG